MRNFFSLQKIAHKTPNAVDQKLEKIQNVSISVTQTGYTEISINDSILWFGFADLSTKEGDVVLGKKESEEGVSLQTVHRFGFIVKTHQNIPLNPFFRVPSSIFKKLLAYVEGA